MDAIAKLGMMIYHSMEALASERMYIWRVTRDERENILTTQLSATDISGIYLKWIHTDNSARIKANINIMSNYRQQTARFQFSFLFSLDNFMLCSRLCHLCPFLSLFLTYICFCLSFTFHHHL
jgi:hypothetical protein